LNTTGDITLLEKILKAAIQFSTKPSDFVMQESIQKEGITELFTGDEI
jgi:hypothetical protein